MEGESCISKKEVIVAFSFFLLTLERYKFFSASSGGIKFMHIYYVLIILLFPLSKIRNARLTKNEILVLVLYLFNLWFSLLVSKNLSKTFLWSFHLSLTLLGPFLLGIWVRPTLNQLLNGVCLGSVPASLIGLFQLIYYSIYPTLWRYSFYGGLPRIYGTGYEPGNYAHILFFGCIPILLHIFYLYKKEKDTPSNMLLLFALLNSMILILSTGRTGWLCFFIFCFLCIFHQPSIKKTKTAIFLIFLFSILTQVSRSFSKGFFDYFNRNLSADPRTEGMKIGWEIVKNHPLFGVGLGGFGSAVKTEIPSYWRNLTSTTEASKIQTLEWDLTPFNSLLEHAINFGFLGIFWFLLGNACLLARSDSDADKKIMFFIIISGIAGSLANQNLFRPYFVFIPIMYYGSKLIDRKRAI